MSKISCPIIIFILTIYIWARLLGHTVVGSIRICSREIYIAHNANPSYEKVAEREREREVYVAV